MRQKADVIDEKSINDINYELLKKQFPNAITIDEDGKYTIDPQKLQMSLDPSKANIKEDGYGLNWVGKKEAYHKAFAKNYKVLKPLNDDNSKNWDNTDNILIKGDNLDALKILRHNYFESIKMIYIDPPYNTQNDGFVYNDNFTTNTKETLEELGYDEDNIEYIENIQGAKTHSGWLSFMYPRLLLARDLLKEDGVIFISIDDNEVAQLKLLCDEIFGEDNFVGEFIWKKKQGGGNDSNVLVVEHEYILAYTKSINNFQLSLDTNYKLDDKLYPFNDDIGEYGLITLDKSSIQYSNSLVFEITDENGNIYYPRVIKGKQSCWRWGKTKVKNDFDKLVFKNGKVYTKYYRPTGIIPKSLLIDTIYGRTETGNDDIKEIFNNEKPFNYPKPVKLIKHFSMIGTNKNDIILDFFAGSGTTAHAVMDLNAQDGGNRKFICVQWAEETPQKSEASRAGYNTIFDITQERIKRAGEKIIGEAKASLPKEKTLLDTIGSEALASPKVDIGFRTFEIVEDNKQKIYQKSLENMTQDDLLEFIDNDIESEEEILYNLLVAESLPLNTKIETIIDKKLYLASNIAFVLGNLSIDELIEKLKSKKVIEYITIYSPNISDDKFTLELESAVGSLGIKGDKLRFRG